MIEVRRIDTTRSGELEKALALVDAVFDEFEANEFLPQGVEHFHSFNKPEIVRPKLASDEMQMWLALSDETIVGVIALRSINHICMFFVDSKYHRQGVGKMLFHIVRDYLCGLNKEFVTVYSSPYAVPVYERLGFVRVAEEKLISAMRCNPMCAFIA